MSELIALYGLRVRDRDSDQAAELTGWLHRFSEAEPGLVGPLGDRYAVSLIPVATFLRSEHRSSVEAMIRAATVWVCDRYERAELGLAAVDASEFEEVCRALAGPYDFGFAPRRESQIASALLDVSAVLGLADVYSDVRNDTLAVELHPTVLLSSDWPDQLSRIGRTNFWDFNPDYADTIDDGAVAAPHLEADEPSLIIPRERWWDLMAISSVLRDRHFPSAIRAAGKA